MIYSVQKTKYFIFNFQDSIDSIIIFLDSTGYCYDNPQYRLYSFYVYCLWIPTPLILTTCY